MKPRKVNKIVEEVTKNIIRRSKPSRLKYLQKLNAAKDLNIRRDLLSCGNIAHSVAGCSSLEKKEIAKNIIWENKFNFYINYLEETKNVDFDWNANFRFKVNSVVSGTFIIHLLYDDDLLADLQVRELLGLGVNIDL